MRLALIIVPVLAVSHLASAGCVAPVKPVRVIAGFQPPATPYGPGHLGVDLAALPGQAVFSPVSGRVTFQGQVAGRPVVSIRSGDRWVSLEPVDTSLTVGLPVSAGEEIGVVGIGGHCSLRCVHLGLRVAGRYVSPLQWHARLVA